MLLRSPDDQLAARQGSEVVERGGMVEGPVVPSLPPRVIQRLGELLRAFYGDLQREPVPERLSRILDALDRDRGVNHDR